MIEIRQYVHFFNETANILRPKDNLYWVDLKFDLDNQIGELIIPDCGGMMDMVPQSSLQEAWIKNLVLKENHKQIWATIWHLLDRNAYNNVVAKLKISPALLKNFTLTIKAKEIKNFIQYIENQKLQPKNYRIDLGSSFLDKNELSTDSFSALKQLDSWENLNALFSTNLIEEETEIEWFFI